MKYLGTNIKYPTISQEMGSAGRVIVQFVVDKDGSISNPEVVRGVDAYLDKEAIQDKFYAKMEARSTEW